MKHTIRKPVTLLLGLMILVLILACGTGNNINSSTDTRTAPNTEEEVVIEKQNTSNETTGQRNAVKKANTYLSYTAFSYKGLIEQLEFEGFSHEEAVYGADNCGADWYEQAVVKAKSYLEYTSFSREGLIEQLEFEGFTHEEAVYGANANYSSNTSGDSESSSGVTMGQQNALEKAKSYLAYTAFSYKGLIEQLEFEGFTHDEAVYGVDNCDADWKEQATKKAKSYLDYSSFSRQGLIDQLEFEGFTHEEAVYGVEANGY
jgi:SOS response regulatory protein OraA/RecX